MVGMCLGFMVMLPPHLIWALEYPRGDLNQDGSISQADGRELLNGFLSGNPAFNFRLWGDFNGDQRIDIADLIALRNYDGDWDGDGSMDEADAFPFDPERWEADEENDFPSEVELDRDDDGFAENVNPWRIDMNSTHDTDGDGIPDNLDDDDDNDGILDVYEEAGWSNGFGGPYVTDPLLSDTDRDGMSDGAEKMLDTNPLNPDTDYDGVLDGDDSDPNDPTVSAPRALLKDRTGKPREARHMTEPEQRINRAWQARLQKTRDEWRKSKEAHAAKGLVGPSFAEYSRQSGQISGRGLGFQGPEAVGSRLESVKSDLFSGAFTYSIPIKLPPGRAGLEPKMDLIYRSTNGDSWLGKGWDLNPGRIERSTRNGVPAYSDASDPPNSDRNPFTPLDNPDVFTYISALGTTQLIFSTTETLQGRVCGVYYCEIDEGAFLRFNHHPDPENSGGGSWEVWMKDGRTAWFNQDQHTTDSVIALPGGEIFSWALESEEDRNGNRIEYHYMQPTGANNLCLAEVQYNFDETDAPLSRVTFGIAQSDHSTSNWASYRESWRSGMKIVSDFFLTTITTTVAQRDEVSEGLTERVRQYRLSYHDLDPLKGRTISCLASVQEFGQTDESAYPPILLEYSENPGGWEYYDSTSGHPYLFPGCITHHFTWNPQGVWDYGAQFADYNGDGLVDCVSNSFYTLRNSYIRYVSLNTGEGWDYDFNAVGSNPWTAPRKFTDRYFSLIWSTSRNYGGTALDLNGDALADLVWRYDVNGVPTNQVCMSTGSGWDSSGDACTSYQLSASLCRTNDINDYRDYGGRFGDLNGDGLSDVLWSNENFKHVALNNGAGWDFDTTGSLAYLAPDYFAKGSARNISYGSFFGDINGDGLADLVWCYDSGAVHFSKRVVNQGTTWGEMIAGSGNNYYYLPTAFNRWESDGRVWDYGARFADVNGDGLVDVIWGHWNTSAQLFNAVALNTGRGWEYDANASHTNPYGSPGYFTVLDASNSWPRGSYIGDINGDNLPDIVWSYTAGNFEPPAQPSPAMAVAIHAGRTPNLLTHIDNGMGGWVDVEYTSSAKGLMKLFDPESGQIEVTENMPFSLNVVSRITRTALRPENINPSDPSETGYGEQAYTTLYRYAGGKYLDREFRGFGKVKEIDAETGNFKITETFQDYCRRGRIRSERSYVASRFTYRKGGMIDGEFLSPAEEEIPWFEPPKLTVETHYRYRVVISEDDDLHLKTFTDTDAKLGLTDFPKGMTLVTPACALTKTYEYAGDYGQERDTASWIATAEEKFYDGRGNLIQAIDYGRVALVSTTATLAALDQPRIDATFVNDSGEGADGRIVRMSRYDQRRGGGWMDVPVLENTAGFYTADFETGTRAAETARILQATKIEYDERNRPIREIRSLNTGPDPITQYEYDAYGNRTAEIDPRGNATLREYDPIYHSFVSEITNAAGLSVQYTVDPGRGSLLSQTDPNGHTREARYDGLGRLVEKTESGGETLLSYDYAYWDEEAGVYFPNRVRLTIHTPTGDIWEETHYDGLGRAYQKLSLGRRGSADPVRVTTEYNDRGLVWKESWPHWTSEADSAQWIFTFYENDDRTTDSAIKTWSSMGLNRPVERRKTLDDGDSASTRTVYERPLTIRAIDARGNELRTVRDAFGNRVEIWEPDESGSVGTATAPQGAMTRYGFDALKNLEFVRRYTNGNTPQSGDGVTKIVYDTLGRKVSMDDPDAGLSLYEYDAAGNSVKTVDARGCHVLRSYDAVNRLKTQSWGDELSEAPSVNVYTYDLGEGQNLAGRLARVQSPHCTIAWSYDPEGRVVHETRSIDGVDYEISMEYDYTGRETRMTYPDGMRLEYGYDPVTQSLDTVTDPDSGQLWLADVEISPFKTANYLALGNGVTRTTEFDYAGRATRLLTESGGSPLSDLRYRFDGNSNISSIEEKAGPQPYGHMHYAYDSLDRLTAGWGATMSGVDAGTELNPRYAYRYDALGRMVSNSRFRNPDFDDYSLEYAYMEESPIHGIGQIRFTKDGSDDVMAHQFQYDAAGYLVRSTNGPAAMGENDLDRIYSWDALGRLESVTNAVGTTNFQYDHGRGRIKKTGPSGETVTYIGSIAEVTTTGMTKHIFAGAMRIATIQPEGQKCFYMTDHLQSSTLITDESGEVLQRMDYEPYGAMIENSRSQNSEGLRHTFTGRESDGETRLLYCGARYYDPVVGMFISPDQLIPNSDDPQLFNRYAYARNNPMVYSDPSGEFPWLFVILGVVLGATMAAATAVPAYMSGQISLGQMIGLILLGGLAGGVGGGLSGAIPAAYTGASTAIQIILGTVGGIVGGAASGFISSMGASLILGDSISEALDKGMWGTIGGAIVGGIGSFLGSSFGAAYSNSIANPAMMSFSQKFWKLAVSQLGKQSFNFVNAGINYSLNLALEKGR